MVANQLLAEHLDNTEIHMESNTKFPPLEDIRWNTTYETEAAEDIKITIPSPREPEPQNQMDFGLPKEIIGVMEDKMETMNKSDVLRNNLIQQQIEIEQQISVLEGQLQRQKEYLAKIEGGIDVLDELKK